MDELRISDSTWMHKGKYKRLVIVQLNQVYNIHLSDYGYSGLHSANLIWSNLKRKLIRENNSNWKKYTYLIDIICMYSIYVF